MTVFAYRLADSDHLRTLDDFQLHSFGDRRRTGRRLKHDPRWLNLARRFGRVGLISPWIANHNVPSTGSQNNVTRPVSVKSAKMARLKKADSEGREESRVSWRDLHAGTGRHPEIRPLAK